MIGGKENCIITAENETWITTRGDTIREETKWIMITKKREEVNEKREGEVVNDRREKREREVDNDTRENQGDAIREETEWIMITKKREVDNDK